MPGHLSGRQKGRPNNNFNADPFLLSDAHRRVTNDVQKFIDMVDYYLKLQPSRDHAEVLADYLLSEARSANNSQHIKSIAQSFVRLISDYESDRAVLLAVAVWERAKEDDVF
jgi:hypothetical protein